MATVTAMADQILPKTDTPGALDVGVPAFIDRMLAGYYTDKERGIIRGGLVAVATDAAELRGKMPRYDVTPSSTAPHPWNLACINCTYRSSAIAARASASIVTTSRSRA